MQVRVGICTAPHIRYEMRENGFLLHDVRIGIGFHWDRYEDQLFEGELTIAHNEDGTETAINTLDIEDYLTSVISSEMSATSSLELLKAHAVISRSWLLRAMTYHPHQGFDVCADDHCQRYEGITRRDANAMAAARVREAVEATRAQVLLENGTNALCDTRYHKCCGSRTELFENCWENVPHRYLTSVECNYCNTRDPHILKQILNNYDQETTDFYRWTVRYSRAELSEIIRLKSGTDFGDIVALRPLKRGPSYRIYEMEIVGTQHQEVVGKELRIRQLLSRTTLYSSAFDVLAPNDDDGSNGVWEFRGRGWGHGVGLCQIGAAVMADQGASYSAILEHYYPHTHLAHLSHGIMPSILTEQ